jgi:molybdate transport system substrate-binding protein
MSMRQAVLAAALSAVLGACSGSSGPTTAPSATPISAPSDGSSGVAGGDLEIYAAASLKSVLAKVEEAYEAANPGTTITISTDSSTALETKIEQGAPADVFLSADISNPLKLVDGGFAAGRPTVFAANRLTVIVPKGNPAGIQSPVDLAKPGVKIIAAGANVPITRYATQLVAKLATVAGYPSGFEAAYASNVVSQEDNVAGIVGKIELGEGDAGIVYVTDATGKDKVETIPVPDDANVLATYGGIVVEASPNQRDADAFLDWLAGPEGQAVLAEFGFLSIAS